MTQAVLASAEAMVSSTIACVSRSISSPPNVRGSSRRKRRASCMAANTSGGSSRAFSMRGAASFRRLVTPRARSRASSLRLFSVVRFCISSTRAPVASADRWSLWPHAKPIAPAAPIGARGQPYHRRAADPCRSRRLTSVNTRGEPPRSPPPTDPARSRSGGPSSSTERAGSFGPSASCSTSR